MPRLKNMWVNALVGGNREIRLDWDNDRRQMIEVKGDAPGDVLAALREAAQFIASEIKDGEI